MPQAANTESSFGVAVVKSVVTNSLPPFATYSFSSAASASVRSAPGALMSSAPASAGMLPLVTRFSSVTVTPALFRVSVKSLVRAVSPWPVSSYSW